MYSSMINSSNYYKLPDFISFTIEKGYLCQCKYCSDDGKTFYHLDDLETHLKKYKFEIMKLDKINKNLITYSLCNNCNNYSKEKCNCK